MVDLAEKALREVPLVVLDVETTGLLPALGHRVVEVAAIRLEQWHEVGQLNQLLNPGRPMDLGASRVNGIRDVDLVGAPPFSAIAADLEALLEGALVVAHNARFDAGFLSAEYGCLIPARPPLPNPWLCTLQLARRLFHFRRNNLGHVVRHFGLRSSRAHRALNDATMTAEILKRMVAQLVSRHPYHDNVGTLLQAQGGPIYMPPPARPRLPAALQQALARRTPVRILYVSRGRKTRRVISPLYATEHNGNIYLVAYCHLRQAQRTFRLDRIAGAEPAE